MMNCYVISNLMYGSVCLTDFYNIAAISLLYLLNLHFPGLIVFKVIYWDLLRMTFPSYSLYPTDTTTESYHYILATSMVEALFFNAIS